MFSFVPIQSGSQQKWQQSKHHYSVWVTLGKSPGHSFFFLILMGLKRDQWDTTKCSQVGNISCAPSFLGLLLGWWESWIHGLLVKTLSMHWKTQILCIWTVPFLHILLKTQLIIAGSSKPPYRHWTLNKQLNSCSSVSIPFLALYLSYLTETVRAPGSPVGEMKRRVTLTISIIISGSYIYVLGREEQLSSNKVLVMTNVILTWDPHNCLYKHTAKQEWLQMPGCGEKSPNILPCFFYFNSQGTAHFCSK